MAVYLPAPHQEARKAIINAAVEDPSQGLLILRLCQQHDNFGTYHAALKTLEEGTGFTRGTLQGVIRRLEEIGLITKTKRMAEDGTHLASEFKVNIPGVTKDELAAAYPGKAKAVRIPANTRPAALMPPNSWVPDLPGVELELWRPVPLTDNDWLCASNFGRMLVVVPGGPLADKIRFEQGSSYTCHPAEVEQYLLGFTINKRTGYVHLIKPNRLDYDHSVAVLVALAFLSRPRYGTQVDHLDCNPLNLAVSNLRWVVPFYSVNLEPADL